MPRPENLFINPNPRDGSKLFSPTKTYYDCGICGAFHAVEFDGDCRQDNARLGIEEIDAKHGGDWIETPMPGGEDFA